MSYQIPGRRARLPSNLGFAICGLATRVRTLLPGFRACLRAVLACLGALLRLRVRALLAACCTVVTHLFAQLADLPRPARLAADRVVTHQAGVVAHLALLGHVFHLVLAAVLHARQALGGAVEARFDAGVLRN